MIITIAIIYVKNRRTKTKKNSVWRWCNKKGLLPIAIWTNCTTPTVRCLSCRCLLLYSLRWRLLQKVRPVRSVTITLICVTIDYWRFLIEHMIVRLFAIHMASIWMDCKHTVSHMVIGSIPMISTLSKNMHIFRHLK